MNDTIEEEFDERSMEIEVTFSLSIWRYLVKVDYFMNTSGDPIFVIAIETKRQNRRSASTSIRTIHV